MTKHQEFTAIRDLELEEISAGFSRENADAFFLGFFATALSPFIAIGTEAAQPGGAKKFFDRIFNKK